jgi:hypothetical protein
MSIAFVALIGLTAWGASALAAGERWARGAFTKLDQGVLQQAFPRASVWIPAFAGMT